MPTRMAAFFEAGRKRAWLFATGAAVAAMTLRAPLTPWLDVRAPFIFAFPAIAMVGFVCGAGPALLTTLICALWAVLPWLSPTIQGPDGLLNLALFLISAGITAVFAGRVRLQALRPDPMEQTDGGTNLMRWLRVSMAVAALLPAAFFVMAAWYSHRQAFDEGQLRIDRAVRIAQEHAAKVMETNDLVLGRVEDVIGDLTDLAIREQEASLHEELHRVTAGIPQLRGAWVIDAQGTALVSSSSYPVRRDIGAAGREFFRWHQAGNQGIYVSAPLSGPIAGERYFSYSRARLTRDGRFNGIISISLYPSYFKAFYDDLAKSEAGLTVTLFRADGTVIARGQEAEGERTPLAADVLESILAGADQGLVHVPRTAGREPRTVAFRRVGQTPLYVAAGIGNGVILAGWYRYLTVLAGFTFPTALGLVYMAWLALGRAQREFQAVQRLKQETLQRALAEDALRQSQKLEAVGRMTGGVAHDVNNLLMVLGNNLHIMKKRIAGVAESAQAASMARAITSGEQLMRKLLAFSRRQPLKPEVVRLEERLPAVIELLRTALDSRVRVRAQIDPGLPTVKLDMAEFELAMLNLGVNAKDAMPKGGELELTVSRAHGPDAERLGRDGVAIAVRDTGHGIAPDILDRVMEPFFTTKPEGRGTGLGLSQVYGLCAQSGGFARIESVEGRGTTVVMVLPATAEPVLEAVAAPAEASEKLEVELLLVEDNLDVANATQPVLESLGCTVTHAVSAGTAIALVTAEPQRFDLVLSDIVMPGGISGLELAQIFRARYPALPIILLTGYAAEVHTAEKLSHTVLMKPCTGAALAEAIRKALAPRETPRDSAGDRRRAG